MSANVTSILITTKNVHKFQNDLNTAFGQIIKWFEVNSLSQNCRKTYFIQFSSKSLNQSDIKITYESDQIPKVKDIKFWGLHINNTLSWKTHIDNILPKLCSACYAMRSFKPYVSQQMMNIIYYSYLHSIMSYGIIFWGHSAGSITVFKLQKKIIRIMVECRSRNSCSKMFIKLQILPLSSLYIFSLLLFVIKNKELFTTNNEIHNIYTRQYLNFHQPSANLTKYQTQVYYMSHKIFNFLPICIK